MKGFVIAIVLVILLGAGGWFGYQILSQAGPSEDRVHEDITVTKSGTLTIATPPGDDYTHIILDGGELVKLNSYSVDLSAYEGKSVRVSGQYSGNTLFVDTVTEGE